MCYPSSELLFKMVSSSELLFIMFIGCDECWDSLCLLCLSTFGCDECWDSFVVGCDFLGQFILLICCDFLNF